MEKLKKGIKITINIITNTLLIIVTLIIIFIGYSRIILKDPSCFSKTTSFYKVVTGSMEPTLHIGDYILIQKQNKYEVGDIVTYKDNNSYTTHRIIKVDKQSITTKGDANNIEDENIIPLKNIKGKYIKKINKFGKVYEKITSRQTIIITILFVIIIRFGAKLLIER